MQNSKKIIIIVYNSQGFLHLWCSCDIESSKPEIAENTANINPNKTHSSITNPTTKNQHQLSKISKKEKKNQKKCKKKN